MAAASRTDRPAPTPVRPRDDRTGRTGRQTASLSSSVRSSARPLVELRNSRSVSPNARPSWGSLAGPNTISADRQNNDQPRNADIVEHASTSLCAYAASRPSGRGRRRAGGAPKRSLLPAPPQTRPRRRSIFCAARSGGRQVPGPDPDTRRSRERTARKNRSTGRPPARCRRIFAVFRQVRRGHHISSS